MDILIITVDKEQFDLSNLGSRPDVGEPLVYSVHFTTSISSCGRLTTENELPSIVAIAGPFIGALQLWVTAQTKPANPWQ